MNVKGTKRTFEDNREVLYLDCVFITWVYIYLSTSKSYIQNGSILLDKNYPSIELRILKCYFGGGDL